jgi:hypothetical protein
MRACGQAKPATCARRASSVGQLWFCDPLPFVTVIITPPHHDHGRWLRVYWCCCCGGPPAKTPSDRVIITDEMDGRGTTTVTWQMHVQAASAPAVDDHLGKTAVVTMTAGVPNVTVCVGGCVSRSVFRALRFAVRLALDKPASPPIRCLYEISAIAAEGCCVLFVVCAGAFIVRVPGTCRCSTTTPAAARTSALGPGCLWSIRKCRRHRCRSTTGASW